MEIQRAGKALAAAGYIVEQTAPLRFAEAAQLWKTILINEARAGFADAIMKLGDKRIKAEMAGFLELTPEIDMKGLVQAFATRETIMREWADFLETYPILVTPVSWQTPFPLDLDQGGTEAVKGILEAQSPMLALVMTGLPCISVPTGVQVVANRFREDRCFDVAEIIEAALPMPTPVTPNA